MSQFNKILVATLGFVVGVNIVAPPCAIAQSSSSETTIETRGVGFKGANVFNPKYKERIGTYEEQIQMGITKGWLTPAEVQQFKTRLEGMKKQEADAAAKGWVKADVDAIDKVFTQFNIDLTKAANKPAASSTSTTSSTTTAKPVDTVAGGETKTTTKATATKKTVKKAKAPVKKTTTTTAKTTTK